MTMAAAKTSAKDEQELGLHTLRPAKGATKVRKRVGRGPASGTGKTSGRGHKGQKARSGHHYMPAGFEGGQMPLYMRISKSRGSTKKMSMPMGPFRTHTQGVNVEKLGRFDAGTEVTPELLKKSGLVGHLRHPVKILGNGELTVKLSVTANAFSASAKEKIEAAGGTATLIPKRAPQVKGTKKSDRPAASAE
jgi:large subunit ribosomal protein L15